MKTGNIKYLPIFFNFAIFNKLNHKAKVKYDLKNILTPQEKY